VMWERGMGPQCSAAHDAGGPPGTAGARRLPIAGEPAAAAARIGTRHTTPRAAARRFERLDRTCALFAAAAGRPSGTARRAGG
jgi:hypothetical protein